MDFIIVGGGIAGCYVAWELAQQGAEVLLLEAAQIASGASGGLGKRGVRANGRDPRELPLMRRAYELWPDLHERIGPTGYEQCGHFWLIEDEEHMDAAPARAWMQQQQGIPTHFILRNELLTFEPDLGDQILAALHCPLDGVADHTATTRAVAQAAASAGAGIRQETALTGIERTGNRVTAVHTSTEEQIAVGKQLLLLSNHHVPSFLRQEFDFKLPVWSWLPTVILTEPIDPVPVRHLIGHASRRVAIKAGPDRNVMISGGWRGRINPHTYQGETQPDQVSGNMAAAAAVYPALDGIGILQATADRLETESADHIPIIDRVPGIDNLLFACGWSGHGWAISPAVGELLAQWALTGEHPALLRPFAYDRFLPKT